MTSKPDDPSKRDLDSRTSGRRRKWLVFPGWLVSLLLHGALLLFMAAYSLESIAKSLSVMLMSGTTTEESSELEEFAIDSSDAMDIDPSEIESVPESLPQTSVAVNDDRSEVKLETTLTVTNSAVQSLTSQLAPSEMLSATLTGMTKSLNSRSSKMKREMLEKYGGNDASEKAVARALEWLAMHQMQDGSWSFNHSLACRNQCNAPGSEINARNGATGLALLPFLGAGQTHLEGEYRQVVLRGLTFLLNSMKVETFDMPTGSWQGNGDSMYGHGIASIALCEAFAMTNDQALAKPAQLSLNFISYAQEPNLGGWQYSPRKGSDTSVAGWQIMALKSGSMGGLVVQPITLKKADAFLNRVQMNKGAFYGYTSPSSKIDGRLATSACGLLCRMYMGWPKEHPALQEGVEYMVQKGPNPKNMYFNYYATQVMKQYGGTAWEKWNPKMRDMLVKSQATSAHASGSWDTDDSHQDRGGRLYVTCMSAMVLEVYYRYMPIYADQSGDEGFKL